MCYFKAVNEKVLYVVRELSLSLGKGKFPPTKKTLLVKQSSELLDF